MVFVSSNLEAKILFWIFNVDRFCLGIQNLSIWEQEIEKKWKNFRNIGSWTIVCYGLALELLFT